MIRARDDGGGDQHLEFLVVESRHTLFDFGRRHLAVRDDVADLRHVIPHERLDIGQIGDAGGDEEALAAAMSERNISSSTRWPGRLTFGSGAICKGTIERS